MVKKLKIPKLTPIFIATIKKNYSQLQKSFFATIKTISLQL